MFQCFINVLKGPLVNSEFYPGWLSHWEEPFQRVDTKNITRVLDEMLSVGASVNIYMFYGGTNFAFTSGKIIKKSRFNFIFFQIVLSFKIFYKAYN